ncbi:hypothetical protein G7Y89_g9344 [Cudoniella acicularis]|uniref:Uncharacterized protein n=1 Tax=Cudoniella acicularis TaxID=354080 RepID=A0A8H4W051_9HELO|nr:hypothetical protein G7Y89_g9344 [Cudoniella acicularis]
MTKKLRVVALPPNVEESRIQLHEMPVLTCDGKKPCKRCASRVETSECIYEVHIKHAKEELVKQIKELRAKDHLTEQILQALSTDEKVPEILERLKNGETYESIVEWLGRSPIEDFETLSPRTSQHSTFEASDHEMGGDIHCLPLDYLHTLFSEGHFVDSYGRKSESYCSPVLVNALCAMACHLHSVAEADEVDFERLGEEFSDAVRMNIDPQDRTVTTIQAFAVMFLVDSNRAKGLRATSYLKVATDSLSSVAYQETNGFEEVWKNTVRGIRNLNVEWAQVTFQVPPVVQYTSFDEVGENESKLDEARWYFYRYVNDQCPAWPGLLATTNREKSKLIRIVQDVATMMYNQQGPQLSAHDVLQQYSRILYSNAVIQLLRPLLDFEGFPTALVEEVIWNHAQQGLYLLDEHYKTQYTCRYQPVLQMFSLLHLTDVVARFFPGGREGGSKDGPEAIYFAMESLMQSRTGLPVAGPLQEMLRRTANECSIRLPRNLSEIMSPPKPPKQMYCIDDLIDACTRPMYCQPVDRIHARYLPSFSADWVSEGPSFGFLELISGISRSRIPSAEERGAQSLMQIHNLLNSN